MKVTTLPIDDIHIGRRYRKDLGDISALAASIQDVGLLHPIVVNAQGKLVAGQRRLSACQKLGWTKIPVHVIDLDEIVRGEFHENVARKEFLPSEAVAIAAALQPRLREQARDRQRGGRGAKLPPEQKGRTRNLVASYLGMSGYTLDKAQAIVDAAKENPTRYGSLKEALDKTGKVDGLFRRLKQLKDQDAVRTTRPSPGKYRTIVIDPPWDYKGLVPHQAMRPGYSAMSLAEMSKLQVSEWAADQCHLYLWTTNNFIKEARELVDAFGFSFKTMLTWVKPRGNPGFYFLASTEHVLFAVKGKLRCKVQNVMTHFNAPRGQHSVKPNEFYDIVEKVSYGPFLDAFARRKRAGWTAWGRVEQNALAGARNVAQP